MIRVIRVILLCIGALSGLSLLLLDAALRRGEVLFRSGQHKTINFHGDRISVSEFDYQLYIGLISIFLVCSVSTVAIHYVIAWIATKSSRS